MEDRLIRWTSYGLVGGLFAWMVGLAAAPLRDPDDWWHLRLGNDLIAQHSLATPDHWSSFATVSWVPTEPLPEVVSAYVERGFGLPGLAFLFGLAAVLVVVTVQLTNRREARLLPATIASLLTVPAMTLSLTPRPQLVSFVLLPIVLSAWLQSERDHRARWWLVPLVWFWSLCHGFWLFGPLVGVVFVVGLGLSRRVPLKSLVRLAAVAVASGVVVALNPVGLGVLEAPVSVHDAAQFVVEWQRTDLLRAAPLAAALMIVGTVVIWVTSRDGVTWPRALILLMSLVMLWYAVRLVAVAALLVAPLFAQALGAALERRRGAREASPSTVRSDLAPLGVGTALAAIVLAFLVPHTSAHPDGVPLALDPALDRLPAGTAVFNDYFVGGWLTWRHPDLDQYIDGLATPYSTQQFEDYVRAVDVAPGWYQVVRDSRAPVALLRTPSALATALPHHGWTVEGTGDGYVLLRRPQGE